jgi:glucose 1-dehydrogenase
MDSLKGKVAVVTGGSSGIGRAICLVLADEGCRVAVLSRSRHPKGSKQPPTDSLLEKGIWVHCDLTKPPYPKSANGSHVGSLQEAFLRVIAEWGRLDILINNAGTLLLKDFMDHNEADYDRVLSTNLKGPVFATQIAIEQMLKQSNPGGQIINISSIWGLVPTWTTVYAASKAALVNFSQNIAAEFGETIKCNCICPGFIDTDILAGSQTKRVSGRRGNLLHEIPLHRKGTPDEVAEVVVWVLKSTYMNGSTVVVDGGRNVRAGTGIRFPDWDVSKDGIS